VFFSDLQKKNPKYNRITTDLHLFSGSKSAIRNPQFAIRNSPHLIIFEPE
jgi:hypothetical protein